MLRTWNWIALTTLVVGTALSGCTIVAGDVDDIAEGTIRAIGLSGFQIINLGGNHPYSMLEAISFIENSLGKKAVLKNLPFPKTDVLATWADISRAGALLKWKPEVSLEAGIKATMQWHEHNESWVRDIHIDTNS